MCPFKTSRVSIQSVPVCTFKTSPCMLAYMRICVSTCARGKKKLVVQCYERSMSSRVASSIVSRELQFCVPESSTAAFLMGREKLTAARAKGMTSKIASPGLRGSDSKQICSEKKDQRGERHSKARATATKTPSLRADTEVRDNQSQKKKTKLALQAREKQTTEVYQNARRRHRKARRPGQMREDGDINGI